MNYKKLMDNNPTSFGKHINSIGQKIEFFEHPFKGDSAPVLCVCHELQLAEESDFYELNDMIADHKEYEPVFIDGVLFHGQFEK